MTFIKSIFISFAMFSRLPVPKTDWNEKNMRYTMAAFPLLGVFIGAVVLAFSLIAVKLSFSPFLRGAILAFLPVLITGGIHLDGFCDTIDALSSRKPLEKKLEILSDSHIGAFAAMGCALYLLLYAAIASEVDVSLGSMISYGCIFVICRCFSGLSVVFFPCAKTSGLARTFADSEARKVSGLILRLLLVIFAAMLVYFGGLPGLIALFGAVVTFCCYYLVSTKSFGGITGDLAGWFLQMCEILALFFLVLGQKLWF